MINKITLAGIVLSALLLSGCGGGNNSKSITDQIKERDGVLIIHSTKSSACSIMTDSVKNQGVKDVIFDSPNNTVSCATYGKKRGDIDDDYAECAETSLVDFSDNSDISLLEDITKACVIGGNN